MEHKTATRHTLSEEWLTLQTKIDWMHAPGMAEYVNGLVSGRSLNSGGHWAEYAKTAHVIPLSQKLDRKLSMASIGCGTGHIEAFLFGECQWPISRFLGLEYDDQLRAKANSDISSRFPGIQSDFSYFDFNSEFTVDETFDIVFCCHSIHHASDLEYTLSAINRCIKDNGIFIGIDYFGPTRFQIEYDVIPIIRELFDSLPEHFRRDLRSPEMPITREFIPDTIKSVRDADISESVRSSDLRTLLFSNFPVIDMKPMGGTLLRWLLQYRAGNFSNSNPDHIAIIKLLQIIEREMIQSRRIKSDDLFFVLEKSGRL